MSDDAIFTREFDRPSLARTICGLWDGLLRDRSKLHQLIPSSIDFIEALEYDAVLRAGDTYPPTIGPFREYCDYPKALEELREFASLSARSPRFIGVDIDWPDRLQLLFVAEFTVAALEAEAKAAP
jgi:hypothetical protein